jgi:iron complex transport system ATP-binding protein
MTAPLLRADAVAFGPPGRTLGRDVGFTLAAGETVALLGPNGAGKTTLLKTLLHLLPPHAGTVSCEGQDIAGWSPARRAARLAYVPQGSGGGFAFPVLDMVLMGRAARRSVLEAPSREDREAARAALDDLGIGHLSARSFTQISGGERQLVLIARAIIQDARVMVLDEPTASLDFANQERVLEVMSWLARRGFAILFSTHHPDQALAIAGHTALLGRDGAFRYGPARDILTEPALTRLYGTAVKIREVDGRTICFTEGHGGIQRHDQHG